MKRRISSILGSCLILLTVALIYYFEIPPATGPAQVSTSTQTYLVTRIVDGDTIELEDGEKVRYIGVNTPESVDPRKTVECFGKEASAKNSELVLNKKVILEKDVSDTDRYGRLLRYVYLDDGTFINLKLVQEGYAQVMTVPPDVARQEELLSAQQQARDSKIGLWSACQ